MSRNRGSGKKTNILLVIICILLVGALGAILVMNQKAEKEESQRLEEIAGDQQRGIEDYEAVKEHAAELEAADAALDESSDDNADAKSDKENNTESKDADFDAGKDADNTDGNAEDADATAQNEDADTEDTAQKSEEISGIVCWGDDLINGEESNTYSYMEVLQKLLTDNGYNMTVINKTLQGGGTLSMMKMAGVGDDILQGYITKHQQAANGGQLNVTETGIRDLTEEELTRNDLDCIPIIFMGYYGGWNHDPAELAFYSKGTTDIEFLFPFGWGELWGIADRTDYDLGRHQETSGQDLTYFDDEKNERYLPYVIEPSLGADRVVLAFLCAAYDEENIGTEEKPDMRTVLHFHPALAPVKIGVLPLSKKLNEGAEKIFAQLSHKYNCEFDDRGNIGKRYRRQDEIGTPFCVTYDFESENDGAVTVRDRDTMEQERIKIEDLDAYFAEKFNW